MTAVPSVAADYNRFDAPKKPGTVFVTLSRKGFCGPKAPGQVLIEVGTIALGQQRNGVLGRVTQRRGWVVDSCAERTFPIATPGGPFHVKVSVTPPFQPARSTRTTSSGATSVRSSGSCSSTRRSRADQRPAPDERLRVLADEPGHAAQVPERVTGEEVRSITAA